MKRLFANRPGWKRLLRQRFSLISLETPEFSGYISLLTIDQVTAPLVRDLHGQPVILADNGYSWLQHFPSGAHYAMTTMFDVGGQVVQWYIDICLRTGVDESGTPWLDDLFLDIVITPQGDVELLDGDELEAAWQSGEIDRTAYELAWREARSLLEGIQEGTFQLPGWSELHRRLFV